MHRIDPEAIRTEVTAAGFVLEARSDQLRNPEDSHALPVFDPAIRHRTDQVSSSFGSPEGNSKRQTRHLEFADHHRGGGAYTVGGTVTGLVGGGLTLSNNGGDNLEVDANGAFTFTTAIGAGDAYSVTINIQPSSPVQACTVSNGEGSVTGANITTVVVDCARFAFVANSGSNNISAYLIDNTSGALTAVAGSPFATGANPSAVIFDPSGQFAYVANAGSNNVSAYTINTTTGVLTAIAGSPFAAGANPSVVNFRFNGTGFFAVRREPELQQCFGLQRRRHYRCAYGHRRPESQEHLQPSVVHSFCGAAVAGS